MCVSIFRFIKVKVHNVLVFQSDSLPSSSLHVTRQHPEDETARIIEMQKNEIRKLRNQVWFTFLT